jgi:hypothetical protein
MSKYSYTSPPPVEYIEAKSEHEIMSYRLAQGYYDLTLPNHPDSLSEDPKVRGHGDLVHMRVKEESEKLTRFREDLLEIYGFIGDLTVFGNRLYDLTVFMCQIQSFDYMVSTHKVMTSVWFGNLVASLFPGYAVVRLKELKAVENATPKNIGGTTKSDAELIDYMEQAKKAAILASQSVIKEEHVDEQ